MIKCTAYFFTFDIYLKNFFNVQCIMISKEFIFCQINLSSQFIMLIIYMIKHTTKIYNKIIKICKIKVLIWDRIMDTLS
jgi:hypothetical protein